MSEEKLTLTEELIQDIRSGEIYDKMYYCRVKGTPVRSYWYVDEPEDGIPEEDMIRYTTEVVA